MIKPQRKIHRITWLLLTPLLLAVIAYFSQPDTDLTPANAPINTNAAAETSAVPFPAPARVRLP